MLRIVPRIILEGARNVLGPSGIFQKKFRGKHLVSARGDKIPRIGGCMFGGFLSREHACFMETCWWLVGGPPHGGRQDVGRPKGCHGGVPLVPPLCYHYALFMCDMKLGYFGISTSHPT